MKKSFLVFSCICIFSSIFCQEATTTLSSDGQLRYFEAETESFFLSRQKDAITRVTENNIIEKTYDDNKRLIQEVTWHKDSLLIESIRKYTYQGDSARPATMNFDNYLQSQRIVERYDRNGNRIERIEYSLQAKEQSNDSPEEAILTTLYEIDEDKTQKVCTKTYTFDNSQRITEEKTLYENNGQASERILYEYKLGINKADVYTFTEDDIKKSIVYSSPSDKTETVFFTNDIFIRVTYKDDNAILEEVFENGKKIRERQL